MESQSDWAQERHTMASFPITESDLQKDINFYKNIINRLESEGYSVEDIQPYKDEIDKAIQRYKASIVSNSHIEQMNHLISDYTSRQIQENLRYAYPVSEERLLDYDRGTVEYDAVKKELYEHPEYSPEHESILRKYTNFPKQYKKLFKDANVRTITDKKGNSWYEVDVPKNYLNQEWQYKYGGIHIKPSKRGTFTAAAKKHGMSVQGFASKVLANKGKYSSAMFKKARFAKNASKWKHKEFGGDMDFNYWMHF